MTTATAKKKPARTLSFNRLVGVLTITQGKAESSYYVDALKHDLGASVRCFSLAKLPATRKEGTPDEYAVSIDAEGGSTCECMGHLRHGHRTECRHVAALRVLIARGTL